MFGRLDTGTSIGVISVLVLFIGTFGNILSLIVLSRKGLRKKNIGLYLIALCVSDLLVLYLSLFNNLLWFTGVYGDTYPKFSCQIIRFFRVLAIDLSSWITVIITVQRTIAIYRPLSTYIRTTSRYRTPLKVLSVLFVVLVTITAIYTSSYTYENNTCKGPPELVQVLLFSFVYSFLPVTILIACNVAIVFRISRRPTIGQTSHTRHNFAQIVRLVLAINIMFLICTLPPSIVFTFATFLLNFQTIMLLSMIMCTNNAFNFVLYIVAGKSFRKELRSMCKSKSKSTVYTITNETDLQNNSAQNRQRPESKSVK